MSENIEREFTIKVKVPIAGCPVMMQFKYCAYVDINGKLDIWVKCEYPEKMWDALMPLVKAAIAEAIIKDTYIVQGKPIEPRVLAPGETLKAPDGSPAKMEVFEIPDDVLSEESKAALGGKEDGEKPTDK